MAVSYFLPLIFLLHFSRTFRKPANVFSLGFSRFSTVVHQSCFAWCGVPREKREEKANERHMLLSELRALWASFRLLF